MSGGNFPGSRGGNCPGVCLRNIRLDGRSNMYF